MGLSLSLSEFSLTFISIQIKGLADNTGTGIDSTAGQSARRPHIPFTTRKGHHHTAYTRNGIPL